jgi:hypothetical protein
VSPGTEKKRVEQPKIETTKTRQKKIIEAHIMVGVVNIPKLGNDLLVFLCQFSLNRRTNTANSENRENKKRRKKRG